MTRSIALSQVTVTATQITVNGVGDAYAAAQLLEAAAYTQQRLNRKRRNREWLAWCVFPTAVFSVLTALLLTAANYDYQADQYQPQSYEINR